MESDSGIILTGETRRSRRKLFPVSPCQPQIPHGVTRGRTRVSAMTVVVCLCVCLFVCLFVYGWMDLCTDGWMHACMELGLSH
jgi:hypothetical protein